MGNRDFDVHTRLNVNARDVLDHLRRRVQINDTLMHAQLEAVIRVRTLTARRLARGDLQVLGRQAHGARHLQALPLGHLRLRSLQQIIAHLLQRAHVTRSQRDTNAVDPITQKKKDNNS